MVRCLPLVARGERILIRGMTRSNVCFRKVPEGAEWGGRRPVRGWGSPAAQAVGGNGPNPGSRQGRKGEWVASDGERVVSCLASVELGGGGRLWVMALGPVVGGTIF